METSFYSFNFNSEIEVFIYSQPKAVLVAKGIIFRSCWLLFLNTTFYYLKTYRERKKKRWFSEREWSVLRGDAGANNQAVNQRYENVFCYSFAVVFLIFQWLNTVTSVQSCERHASSCLQWPFCFFAFMCALHMSVTQKWRREETHRQQYTLVTVFL